MEFTSLEQVKAICQRIANGDLIDTDSIDAQALRVPVPPGEEARLPYLVLQILAPFVERQDDLFKQCELAKATNKILAEAVLFLALEVEKTQ